MKMTITITKEERDKTLNDIMFDPCFHMLCSGIHCDSCPLQTVTEALRRAQENYARTINEIPIEGE